MEVLWTEEGPIAFVKDGNIAWTTIGSLYQGDVVVSGDDVFFENRHSISSGMKPLTAAGIGGVLIE